MIYTIGFTQKSAERFFNLLNDNKVDLVVDVRLNNTSQLASFAKFPDIQFFLKKICDINYVHDVLFAPTEDLLKGYKNKQISWDDYEIIFKKIMIERNIDKHIKEKYVEYTDKNICLLCSESTEKQCHRRLVAEIFQGIYKSQVVHL